MKTFLFTLLSMTLVRLLDAQTQSVGVSDNTPTLFLNISGSPITGSPNLNGTINLSFASQSSTGSTFFLAGPVLGSGSAVPSFRTIQADDLPDAASSVSGIINTSDQI